MKSKKIASAEIEALCQKWIAHEQKYRAQVKEPMSAATPFAGIRRIAGIRRMVWMARADQLAECGRALQVAAGLLADPETILSTKSRKVTTSDREQFLREWIRSGGINSTQPGAWARFKIEHGLSE